MKAPDITSCDLSNEEKINMLKEYIDYLEDNQYKVDFIKELVNNFNHSVHNVGKLEAHYKETFLNSNYFIPDIHFGSRSTIHSAVSNTAIFCEIWVNSICVFREYTVLEVEDEIEEIRENKIQKTRLKLMSSLINSAIYNEYDNTLNRLNNER